MKRHATSHLAAVASFAGLLLAASAGSAQGMDPVDVVTLHDETILRGHVTEIRPGRDLTIVLLNPRSAASTPLRVGFAPVNGGAGLVVGGGF